MTRRRSLLGGMTAMTAAALATLPISAAHAVYVRSDVPVDQYNAIGQQPQFAAAAYIRLYTVVDGGVSTGSCSGTLISPTKILTAAHCFVSDTGVASAYTQGQVGFSTMVPSFDTSATSNIASVANSTLYTSGPTAGKATNDISIVTLTTPVTDIKPATLFAGNPAGANISFVGYGSQGLGDSTTPGIPGANNRLGGNNVLDVATTDVLKFDFDSPAGNTSTIGSAIALPLEASVAGGDSGSGVYASIDGTYLVAGDLNGGNNPVNPSQSNLYGESNSYAPVANKDNTAFIIANAPDAMFDQRMLANGTLTVAPVSDATLTQNIVKFGSVIAPNDTLDLESETQAETAVPEPASALLLLAGLAGTSLARRRTRRPATA